MTLERYNKLLIAILGTSALLAATGLLVALAAIRWQASARSEHNDTRVALQRSRDAPTSSTLYFCLPIPVTDAALQVLPLAAANPRNPNDSSIDLAAEISVSSRVDRRFEPCSFYNNRIFDVIVRDTRSGRQSLLLNRPALIDSFQQADVACEQGKGQLPCGMRMWLVRDADTNRNGAIDLKDALIAYDMNEAGMLRRVTPADASVLQFTWDRGRNSLLYTVMRDSDRDGELTRTDQTDVLEYLPATGREAVSIIDAALTAQLLRQ